MSNQTEKKVEKSHIRRSVAKHGFAPLWLTVIAYAHGTDVRARYIDEAMRYWPASDICTIFFETL